MYLTINHASSHGISLWKLYVTSSSFLGASAKLRKATISLVMYVCPSVHKELGPYWTDFHEILYLSAFLKSGDKVQFSLKSDKNNWNFTGRPLDIFDHISLSPSQNEEYFWQICRDQNPHFMFNNFFFVFENRAVYEVISRNIVEPDGPQMTIRRMRIACWIPKATNTHSI
jgi:hypothetical protein